jgi:hypothetical protein
MLAFRSVPDGKESGMKVKFFLSIGFPKATREEEIEIDPEDIDGMTEREIEDYLNQYAADWSQTL